MMAVTASYPCESKKELKTHVLTNITKSTSKLESLSQRFMLKRFLLLWQTSKAESQYDNEETVFSNNKLRVKLNTLTHQQNLISKRAHIRLVLTLCTGSEKIACDEFKTLYYPVRDPTVEFNESTELTFDHTTKNLYLRVHIIEKSKNIILATGISTNLVRLVNKTETILDIPMQDGYIRTEAVLEISVVETCLVRSLYLHIKLTCTY
jgi:hypothetical protein